MCAGQSEHEGLVDPRGLTARISVAIPTFNRPDYLVRAIESVLGQELKPFELLVVVRETDAPSNAVLDTLADRECGIPIRKVFVEKPGFLPPVLAAIDAACGDILAMLDDDAEAHPDWLRRIEKHYADEAVGGVGGRCINYFHGVMQHYAPVGTVGKLYWYGRSVGNMYCDCTFSDPMNVDFLMGGNFSYRLPLLRMCKPDERLGENVAFHWEMDVGLQVAAKGKKILFDPAVVVDHHSAPREIDGLRTVNYEGVYWSNFNYAHLMRKHLSMPGLVSYMAYSFLIGWSGSPGFLYWVVSLLRGKPLVWYEMVIASLRGRIDGLSGRKRKAPNLR